MFRTVSKVDAFEVSIIGLHMDVLFQGVLGTVYVFLKFKVVLWQTNSYLTVHDYT